MMIVTVRELLQLEGATANALSGQLYLSTGGINSNVSLELDRCNQRIAALRSYELSGIQNVDVYGFYNGWGISPPPNVMGYIRERQRVEQAQYAASVNPMNRLGATPGMYNARPGYPEVATPTMAQPMGVSRGVGRTLSGTSSVIPPTTQIGQQVTNISSTNTTLGTSRISQRLANTTPTVNDTLAQTRAMSNAMNNVPVVDIPPKPLVDPETKYPPLVADGIHASRKEFDTSFIYMCEGEEQIKFPDISNLEMVSTEYDHLVDAEIKSINREFKGEIAKYYSKTYKALVSSIIATELNNFVLAKYDTLERVTVAIRKIMVMDAKVGKWIDSRLGKYINVMLEQVYRRDLSGSGSYLSDIEDIVKYFNTITEKDKYLQFKAIMDSLVNFINKHFKLSMNTVDETTRLTKIELSTWKYLAVLPKHYSTAIDYVANFTPGVYTLTVESAPSLFNSCIKLLQKITVEDKLEKVFYILIGNKYMGIRRVDNNTLTVDIK